MTFWARLAKFGERPALVDGQSGQATTYAQLAVQVGRLAERLAEANPTGEKPLCFLLTENSPATVMAYLALLQLGWPTALVNAELPGELVSGLIAKYVPECVCNASASGVWPFEANVYQDVLLREEVRVAFRRGDHGGAFADGLALLLTTSGSTGSPKFVRLTGDNVAANAEAIASYLGIEASDRAITSLPIHYSYGLSVVNSHLTRGASLVCTNHSLVTADFWNAFRRHEATSLAGVPFMYEALRRMRFERLSLPSLRTLTQAGGRLRRETKEYVLNEAERRGVRFFVMYGQTEATARISYVPCEALRGKLDSIGVAIPGGQLAVERAPDAADGVGELVYRGPNVMLGYAMSRACLARGDELGGTLYTGDLGWCDDDGYYYVTGRRDRYAKVLGNRIQLDEVEQLLEARLGLAVACVAADDSLKLLCQDQGAGRNEAEIATSVGRLLGLHASAIQVRVVSRLPLTATLKKDYRCVHEHFNVG